MFCQSVKIQKEQSQACNSNVTQNMEKFDMNFTILHGSV